MLWRQGFNLVPVLDYAYDPGIMTHSNILVQKSLRCSAFLQPLTLSTLPGTYAKAENGLCHLSVYKPSVAPHCPPSPYS